VTAPLCSRFRPRAAPAPAPATAAGADSGRAPPGADVG